MSSAQVTEGGPARGGPLTAVPETLCADLQGNPKTDVRIDVYTSPYGGQEAGAPYEERPPRGPRPRGGRGLER
ncbi:hypothetical protein [Methylobacterium crusticola]|nr:hypothetical protein [Methylobacterium crusticola]